MNWFCCCTTEEINTPWCGIATGQSKLFVYQGVFSSTILDSESFSAVLLPYGISWDGTNTPWCYTSIVGDEKLLLQSGQFTSTIKDSQSVNGFETNLFQATGISWDGTNTPWAGRVNLGGGSFEGYLYLLSGQFTSTIKTSTEVTSVTHGPSGISWDGTNTPWCSSASGPAHAKLLLQSGQFTSTLKDSEDVSSSELCGDISWNGTDTPWSGTTNDKLYIQSGQFTSTIKTSQSVHGTWNPYGINTTALTTG